MYSSEKPSRKKTQSDKPPQLRRKRRRGNYNYATANSGAAVTGQKPVERIIDLLTQEKCKVVSSGDGWIAQCPAHSDLTPSLSINEGSDGEALIYCHTGCEAEDVLEALDLSLQDLYPAPNRTSTTRPRPPKVKTSSNGVQSPNRKTRQKAAGPVDKKWATLTWEFLKNISTEKREHLAEKLGVRRKDLETLGIGWMSGKTSDSGVYTFPEHNGFGEVIGIATRTEDGEKRFLKGGHRGLYLPNGWRKRPGPFFIAEGASDTAALTAMGLAGIGRPSAKGGAELLADLLADIPTERQIIVLAEFDPKPNGTWPGRDGAEKVAHKLSQKLDREIHWGLMPNQLKDVREWLLQQHQEGDYDD